MKFRDWCIALIGGLVCLGLFSWLGCASKPMALPPLPLIRQGYVIDKHFVPGGVRQIVSIVEPPGRTEKVMKVRRVTAPDGWFLEVRGTLPSGQNRTGLLQVPRDVWEAAEKGTWASGGTPYPIGDSGPEVAARRATLPL